MGAVNIDVRKNKMRMWPLWVRTSC